MSTSTLIKKFWNEEDFDNFIINDSVLNLRHYIKKVLNAKNSKKYIIVKVHLRKHNAVQSNILTEFNKTIRMHRSFINSEQLENSL